MIGFFELILILIIIILFIKLWNTKKDSIEEKKTILSKYDPNKDKKFILDELEDQFIALNKLNIIDYANPSAKIRFGNNLFGARPSASGLVRLTYLVSDGPIVNGASSFTFKDGQIGLDAVQAGSAIITVISSASGGNTIEDINSIKYNAPLSFIAQERAVTSDDYKSLIMKNFTGLDNVATWGGETETIPQFGKVYI